MTFTNHQVAFATVHGYRMVWIPGAFGNGKTMLAMGMYAQYFLPRGYKLVSNTQSIWTEKDVNSLSLDENGHLKVFILIDEGGQYFEDGDDIRDLLRNPRKMDYVLCFPSFHPPHRSAQIFQIQPTWSYRSAGIPYIHFDWYVKVGQYKAKGAFGWWWFQEMYGTYSSQNPGQSPGTIRKWLSNQNKLFRERFGYDDDDDVLDGTERAVLPLAGGFGNPLVENKIDVSAQSAYSIAERALRANRDLEDNLALTEEATDEYETLLARNSKRGKRS
jgi:hypothetical protein